MTASATRGRPKIPHRIHFVRSPGDPSDDPAVPSAVAVRRIIIRRTLRLRYRPRYDFRPALRAIFLGSVLLNPNAPIGRALRIKALRVIGKFSNLADHSFNGRRAVHKHGGACVDIWVHILELRMRRTTVHSCRTEMYAARVTPRRSRGALNTTLPEV